MKVIAGQYGGRVLKSVRGPGTRPLLGQVREALFEILGGRLEDALAWDLFAGTGASGIEALSRGARRVLFVEKNNRALGVLEDNLKLLGEEGQKAGLVVRGDAWDPATLTENAETAEPPNVVFLDPPYSMVAEDPVRSVYRAGQILGCTAPGGILAFHFMEGLLQEDDFDPGMRVDIRHWGNSGIAFVELASAVVDADQKATESPSAS